MARFQYQVSELLDLAHSPLVKEPEGMQPVVIRPKDQRQQTGTDGNAGANNGMSRSQRARNRSQQWADGGSNGHNSFVSGNPRRYGINGGAFGGLGRPHHHKNGLPGEVPEGNDTEETVDWLDPTADDQPSLAFGGKADSVAEFERWKQTKKQSSLRKAAYADSGDDSREETSAENPTAFQGSVLGELDFKQVQGQEQSVTQQPSASSSDFWDASPSLSAQPAQKQNSGSSRFSSFFGPGKSRTTGSSSNSQTPVAQAPELSGSSSANPGFPPFGAMSGPGMGPPPGLSAVPPGLGSNSSPHMQGPPPGLRGTQGVPPGLSAHMNMHGPPRGFGIPPGVPPSGPPPGLHGPPPGLGPGGPPPGLQRGHPGAPPGLLPQQILPADLSNSSNATASLQNKISPGMDDAFFSSLLAKKNGA